MDTDSEYMHTHTDLEVFLYSPVLPIPTRISFFLVFPFAMVPRYLFRNEIPISLSVFLFATVQPVLPNTETVSSTHRHHPTYLATRLVDPVAHTSVQTSKFWKRSEFYSAAIDKA